MCDSKTLYKLEYRKTCSVYAIFSKQIFTSKISAVTNTFSGPDEIKYKIHTFPAEHLYLPLFHPPAMPVSENICNSKLIRSGPLIGCLGSASKP